MGSRNADSDQNLSETVSGLNSQYLYPITSDGVDKTHQVRE